MAYVELNNGRVKMKKRSKYSRGVRPIGTVYVLKVLLDSGEIIHKIGYTTRGLNSRLLENALSLYNVLGYIPRISVRHEMTTRYYREIESYLLRELRSYRYEWCTEFNGCTEYIKIDDGTDIDSIYLHAMNKPLDYIVPNGKVPESVYVSSSMDCDPVIIDCEQVVIDG